MQQALKVYKQKSLWSVVVGKKEFFLTDDQIKILTENASARFITFGSIIINPAFVQTMEKLSPERELTWEERKLSEKFT